MTFLIRITVQLLFFQILSAQTVIKRGEKIKTIDRLCFIQNLGTNVDFFPYPRTYYQMMTQCADGTVLVQMSINNYAPDYSLHVNIKQCRATLRSFFQNQCEGQIFLVNYTLILQFSILVNSQLNTDASPINYNSNFHMFLISIDISNNQTASISKSIDVFVMRQGHQFSGTHVTINGVSYMQSNSTNLAYFIPDLGNTSYSGIIDLDDVVDYVIQNNIINPTDIIQQVKILSVNTKGIFDLSISYSMIYDTLVYLRNTSIGIIGGYNCFLQLNQEKIKNGEYLEVHTPATPKQLSDIKVLCHVGLLNQHLKGFFQIRYGYYNSWVTPIPTYEFPLDPRQNNFFIVTASYMYTSSTTDAVAVCWVFRLRTDYDKASQSFTNNTFTAQKQIHICPYWESAIYPAAEETFIENWNVSTQFNNIYTFRFSENSGNPYIYTFRTTSIGPITDDLDLFKFVTKLVNANKIGSAYLISGLSFMFKAYVCSGNFSINSIRTSKQSCDLGAFFSGMSCVQCNNAIVGCLQCTSNSVCIQCDNQANWTLSNSNCVCSPGFYQTTQNISAICDFCSRVMNGCVECSNSSVCTKCDPILNFIVNGSSCSCQPGFYEYFLIKTLQCRPCSRGCLNCLAGGSVCVTCNQTGYWALNGTNCICEIGSYFQSDQCNSCSRIPGCIQCSNSSFCQNCDSNWNLKNGICSCQKGNLEVGKGVDSKCISISRINTSLSCMFMDQGQTLQTCLNSPTTKTSIILNVVSLPNIALFLRVSQIYSFIDDFTYYIYHNARYGHKFDLFLRFMWNLTNQRFIPYTIAGFYYDIQDKYDELIDQKIVENVPRVWVDLGEGTTFLGNTRDCWMGLLPFNIMFFLLIHSIYRLLVRFKLKLAKHLLSFKWISILVFSLLSQNIQFLSFRSFQHLLYAGPPSNQQSKLVYFSNYITCYLTLFFVVVFACSGVGLLRYLIKANSRYSLDFIQYSQLTLWYFGITQFIRFYNGFVHAWFYQNNFLQFIFLCIGQIVFLIGIVTFRKIFKLKSFLALIVSEYIFRIVLHTYLFARVHINTQKITMTDIEDNLLDDSALTLVFVIMLVAFFQSFTLIAFQKYSTNSLTQISFRVIGKIKNFKAIQSDKSKENKQKKKFKFKTEGKLTIPQQTLYTDQKISKETTRKLQKQNFNTKSGYSNCGKNIVRTGVNLKIKSTATPNIVSKFMTYIGVKKNPIDSSCMNII